MVVLFDCSTRKAIREMLINKCFEARDEFNRIPHGLAHSLVLEYREQFPFITDAVSVMGSVEEEKEKGMYKLVHPFRHNNGPRSLNLT